MTQKRATEKDENPQGVWQHTALANSYYTLLGLHPSASVIEIRRAYRELSKRYHPDTTELPPAIATEKFQKLNEAYATLSSPERRMAYDQKIRYSRIPVIQPPVALNRPVSQQRQTQHSAAYLDPTDRPLSAGEIFALFILGVTFLGCLLIAIAIGVVREGATVEPVALSTPPNTVLVREIGQDMPALQLLSPQKP
ncbi:J domain-containing protein [Kamptonema formosum]|uniref:J domain-containing protein n=1 Tax=Kamptonema formosum TaxID=331992 RepID=UPI00034909FC